MDPTTINIALCKALGLDPTELQAVTIRLEACKAPTVQVEYGVRYLMEHPELAEALAEFELVSALEPDGVG